MRLPEPLRAAGGVPARPGGRDKTATRGRGPGGSVTPVGQDVQRTGLLLMSTAMISEVEIR